jgi:nucleotide-binding universal stress UspA family protein
MRLQALVDRAARRFQPPGDGAEPPDPPVRIRILEGGDPEQAIVDEVSREGHDLLITVAAGTPLSTTWRSRDVDRPLLRDCPCPVWLLDPVQHRGPSVVVVGIDVSPERSLDLNRRILSTAAAIAGEWNADLHVVHACSLVGEGALSRSFAGRSTHNLRQLRGRIREERRVRLQALLDAVPEAKGASVRVQDGDAFKALLQATHRLEADVLVLGHSQRTGLPRLLFGNLSENLLGRVHASLVVVKESPPPAHPPPVAAVQAEPTFGLVRS